jgi:hypothetical protein
MTNGDRFGQHLKLKRPTIEIVEINDFADMFEVW